MKQKVLNPWDSDFDVMVNEMIHGKKEEFDLCPHCGEMTLQIPPDQLYWQIFCFSCSLLVSFIDPSLGFSKAGRGFLVGENSFSEEEFERFLKIKSFQ